MRRYGEALKRDMLQECLGISLKCRENSLERSEKCMRTTEDLLTKCCAVGKVIEG